MNNEEWTPEELERLRAARADGVPPPGLEDDTVILLRERGLVRRGRLTAVPVASAFRRKWVTAAGLIGVAAALVIAVVWGITNNRAAPAVPTGPRFVLLLYAGTDPAAAAAESRRAEYAAWARDVASRGVAISGEELSDETREVGPSAGPTVDLPRGFFVVSAADLDSARQIASTCPHLRYGGRIVVKRIV
jgi:hypothetical protein